MDQELPQDINPPLSMAGTMDPLLTNTSLLNISTTGNFFILVMQAVTETSVTP